MPAKSVKDGCTAVTASERAKSTWRTPSGHHQPQRLQGQMSHRATRLEDRCPTLALDDASARAEIGMAPPFRALRATRRGGQDARAAGEAGRARVLVRAVCAAGGAARDRALGSRPTGRGPSARDGAFSVTRETAQRCLLAGTSRVTASAFAPHHQRAASHPGSCQSANSELSGNRGRIVDEAARPEIGEERGSRRLWQDTCSSRMTRPKPKAIETRAGPSATGATPVESLVLAPVDAGELMT